MCAHTETHSPRPRKERGGAAVLVGDWGMESRGYMSDHHLGAVPKSSAGTSAPLCPRDRSVRAVTQMFAERPVCAEVWSPQCGGAPADPRLAHWGGSQAAALRRAGAESSASTSAREHQPNLCQRELWAGNKSRWSSFPPRAASLDIHTQLEES